jgi:hypothetical protein
MNKKLTEEEYDTLLNLEEIETEEIFDDTHLANHEVTEND